ncbi:hypothetical protein [Novosphingobium sp.]|jgi:Flp pilus assembly pilin Flp|uniref:Flp family type IVb pilin n=1 Tax=Novosphingobium sp. TaxID=1874826 RepID=UPI001ECB14A1|nr:hypothetical protein [Novosphingobium sp.]MBK6800859.1 Flp family type IVb pilin [Novosphingobium sp.]MBK9011417.1 Flp family type IVb pilin [Novosphingobium sp.]
MNTLRTLLADETGTGAVELGLVLCLITMSMFGAVIGLGEGVMESFNSTAAKVAAATP